MPFIQQIARSHWRRWDRIQGKTGFADIESAGRQALLMALQRWRPDFNKPLAHYASRWITESCKQEAACLSQGACTLSWRVKVLCQKYRALSTAGHIQEREALLRHTRVRKVTALAVRYLAQAETTQALSLDCKRSDGEEGISLPADGIAPDTQADISEQVRAVRRFLLQQCSARERLIFFLCIPETPLSAEEIGDVMHKKGHRIPIERADLNEYRDTLSTIGELLGMTGERVRQIQAVTLEKLRTILQTRDGVATIATKAQR